MSAVWQTRLASSASRVMQAASTWFLFLSRPERFRLVQRGLIAVLLLWCVWSLWRAIWSFVPVPPPLPSLDLLNPVVTADSRASAAQVDIEALVNAQLFGKPGESAAENLAAAQAAEPLPLPLTEAEAAVSLAGIEDGAPETRLPFTLRGVVASSEAGLGQAVIEHRKVQDLYQVGDELPVNGRVVLAKVLPTQVVLDNDGRYELLKLFDDSPLARSAASVPPRGPRPAQTTESAPEPVEAAEPVSEEVASLAAQYRDQLYSNPQSLADVVRVTAVREDGALRGYRVAPGKAGEAFSSLGFQSGDLVTAVNGMSLTDPSNTVRLYQAMRSADEAVFEMEREGEPVVLSVSIAQETGETRR